MTTKTALKSNVIKTYQQFDNLDFQDGWEWNDEASYGENLNAAIRSLEAHNNVVLSGDALRAASDPESMSILPSNRGTLLWMYNSALDAVDGLKDELKSTNDSYQSTSRCFCGQNHDTEPHDLLSEKQRIRMEIADKKKMIVALESTLTCKELTKVHNFRSSQPFNSYDAYAIGAVGVLLGFLPWYIEFTEHFVVRLFAGWLCMLLGYILMTIVGKNIIYNLIEIRSKRLAIHVSRFTTTEDADYLDWDVPGVKWNDALTDTENKEAIVKAIETHNQVILVVDALAAVQKEAKAYYSPTPVKRIPRKTKAYGQTKARKGRNTAITIVCHTH